MALSVNCVIRIEHNQREVVCSISRQFAIELKFEQLTINRRQIQFIYMLIISYFFQIQAPFSFRSGYKHQQQR